MEKNINGINFSVIIPHKNIPFLLQRCLNSIPRRDDLQIIIVDDCSDCDVVNSHEFPGLRDEHVDLIFLSEGKGGGHARNVGLEKAVGKWVIFADADDFFTNNFSQFLDINCGNNVDVIYSNVDSVYSDNLQKKAFRNVAKQDLFFVYENKPNEGEILFRLNYSEPWGKMIKRSLISSHNIRFDEIPVSNDYFFSVQVGCLAKKIKIANECTYIVTVRPGSLSYKFGDSINNLIIRLNVAVRVQCYYNKFGYELNPMPIRGLMVLLLKKNFFIFIKQIFKIYLAGVPIHKLLFQMFNPRFFTK